jgi:hypothetical protein
MLGAFKINCRILAGSVEGKFLNRLSLAVTSREVVRLFLEQFRFDFVPLFHGLQGRFAA